MPKVLINKWQHSQDKTCSALDNDNDLSTELAMTMNKAIIHCDEILPKFIQIRTVYIEIHMKSG